MIFRALLYNMPLYFNHTGQWAILYRLETKVTLQDSPTVLTAGNSFILRFASSDLRHFFIPNPYSNECLTILYFSFSPLSAPRCVNKVLLIALTEDTQQCFYIQNRKDNMKVYRQTRRKKVLFGIYTMPVAGKYLFITWIAFDLMEPM